jgi:predicted ATP-grasp superfamily ATP-dependent carboligase
VSVATPTRKVLVLGKSDSSCLTVIRSLGRQGIEVHVAWCPPDAVLLRSRYVQRVHALPAFSPASEAWKRALVELCRREGFDLVIPTNDPTIIPLQEHRADLEPHARIYLLNDRAFEIGYDKQKSYALCRALGLRVPQVRVLPIPAEPADVLREFRLPVVVKARSSFRAEDLGDRRRTRVARDEADLRRWLGLLEGRADDVLIEDYFEGEGGGIDVLCADGEVLHAFQHLRLHEGRGYSSAPYRVSAPVHPGMLAETRRYVRALDYTGVLMLEFRLNAATGDWIFHDFNARFWAALPLTVAAGADYPYWLYQVLVEGRRDFPPAFRTGIACRNWRLDLLWLKEHLGLPRGERTPGREIAREVWRALTLREWSDTLTLDDPMPGLVDVSRILGRLGRNLGRLGRLGASEPSLGGS